MLENSHSKECKDLSMINTKNKTNLIDNYNEFIKNALHTQILLKIIIKKHFQINYFKYIMKINIILN